MEMLKDPIAELFQQLEEQNDVFEIKQEERDSAIRQINEDMAQFSLKQRSYFNKSVESARTAYLTF